MNISTFATIHWQVTHQDPVINPPGLSPVVADPTFLLPHQAPDRRWHLFAHSVWGVHHFTSQDGLVWHKPRLVLRHAMRPYLYYEDKRYYLLYERYKPFRIFFSGFPRLKWQSRIEIRVSEDLVHWSAPHILLEPSLAWHTDPSLGASVSNPCLLKDGDRYALYYSASLVHLPDCGFNEPLFIGVGYSKDLKTRFEPASQPLISPRAEDRWCNLGAGSIKVLKMDDGYIGLQNGIYWDPPTKHTGSAISVLHSPDGLKWDYVHDQPILKPSFGWRRSFIYACDLKFHPERDTWYLFYNARNDWPISRGREHIGFVVGTLPGDAATTM